MTYVLDASAFTPRTREEEIREAVWSSLVRVEIAHRPRPSDIAARCLFDDLGDVTLCSVSANATTIERTPGLSGDGSSHLFLGLQAAGSSMVVQDGREAVLRTGEMALYDTSRPYTLVNDAGINHHYFRIPRSALYFAESELSGLTAVRLSNGDAVARLLSGYLLRLVAELRRPGGGSVPQVGRPTVELVRAALSVRLRSSVRSDVAHETLRTRILEYIEQHLAEPGLGPARIAAAHHVSVRQLYLVLAGAGIGLGDWIRHRRLERCRVELENTGRSTTVAAIAFRWGFTDQSHFSRAFRTAYGMSPTEWRHSRGDMP